MKKIVIITSLGGGGHVSVNHALTEILSPEYKVRSVDLFGELLRSIDPVRLLTFGAYSGDDFYNYFLKRHAYRALNIFARISHGYFDRRSGAIAARIEHFLIQEKPDIAISVCPYFNGYIAKVTQKLHIPFILVPTDLDMTTFIRGVSKDHTHMRMALSFDDPLIHQQLQGYALHREVTGFPVKEAFTAKIPSNNDDIRQTFAIPKQVKTVMILMGAQGSSASYDFTKTFVASTERLHLLICLGKNEQVGDRIRALPFPAHVTYSLIGFTTRIAELMAVSDLIITKSGSVSLCEALYSAKPVLLDATSEVLAWEKLNHVFVEKNFLGYSITSYDQVVPLAQMLLIGNKKLQTVYSLYGDNVGTHEIKKMISRMLSLR